jgi:hypothetical protein
MKAADFIRELTDHVLTGSDCLQLNSVWSAEQTFFGSIIAIYLFIYLFTVIIVCMWYVTVGLCTDQWSNAAEFIMHGCKILCMQYALFLQSDDNVIITIYTVCS